jgi:hypothetical protein
MTLQALPSPGHEARRVLGNEERLNENGPGERENQVPDEQNRRGNVANNGIPLVVAPGASEITLLVAPKQKKQLFSEFPEFS